MRDNVIPFVRNIHRDVLGLTVHDESHLDALWQTADCIAGDDFELTPVEAFVFGASTLLHDTGLAVAAYPGGIAELRETITWKDAAASINSRRKSSSNEEISKQQEREILFYTLRKLHAAQADKLVSFTFQRPNRTEAIPLLQDTGLHDALATAIGRIAHSHHWAADELADKLVTIAGTVPGFPPDWTLNELKVACLLRCADAAHVDALRAPTMQFAISQVTGNSLDHWQFQNKLNTVTRLNDKLIFYAGQPFSIEDASSWWLAYDTLRMIDNEIKNCNTILGETATQQFAVTGVSGADSPRLLSKTLRVEGWTPVNAEVKVTDPVHLARTLGGRNLYGSGLVAPVRELLQNAVDAVRARRTLQARDPRWGKIRIIIERPDVNLPDVWMHVDDNGIGMSERVVTGPLIDFGKSFWSSSLLDEEFPGLRGRTPSFIGKFGIGFFSIFLAGDAVRVITRRCDASEASAVVLSFDELNRRPLLRRAATGELPLDYSTRVSVKLNINSLEQISKTNDGIIHFNFIDIIKGLVATVDVDIEINDRINSVKYEHSGDWINCNSQIFLEEAYSSRIGDDKNYLMASHSKRVTLICEDNGSVVGRGALFFGNTQRRRPCVVSVGGFSALRTGLSPGALFMEDISSVPRALSIVGIVLGETVDATRASATPIVSREALARWAQEQDELLDVSGLTQVEGVSVCQNLLDFGIASKRLPFCFLSGKFVTVAEFKVSISNVEYIELPLTHSEFSNNFSFMDLDDIRTPYFTLKLRPAVAILQMEDSPRSFLEEGRRREIGENGGGPITPEEVGKFLSIRSFRNLFEITEVAWSKIPTASIERVELVAADASAGTLGSWALRLKRERN